MVEREVKVIEDQAEVQYEVRYRVWSEEEVGKALNKLPLPEVGDAQTLARKKVSIGETSVSVEMVILWDLRKGNFNYVPFEGQTIIAGSVETGHSPSYNQYPILFRVSAEEFSFSNDLQPQALKYDLNIQGRTIQGLHELSPREQTGVLDGKEVRELILPFNKDILSDITITFHKDNGQES